MHALAEIFALLTTINYKQSNSNMRKKMANIQLD